MNKPQNLKYGIGISSVPIDDREIVALKYDEVSDKVFVFKCCFCIKEEALYELLNIGVDESLFADITVGFYDDTYNKVDFQFWFDIPDKNILINEQKNIDLLKFSADQLNEEDAKIYLKWLDTRIKICNKEYHSYDE